MVLGSVGSEMVIVALLVLGFILAVLGGLLVTAVRRRRVVLIIPIAPLLWVASSQTVDYRLRMAAAVGVAGLVVAVVFPRRRTEGSASRERLGPAAVLAVVGAGVLVWSMINGMGEPAHIDKGEETFTARLTEAEPIAIRSLALRAHDLPDGAVAEVDHVVVSDDRIRKDLVLLEPDPATCPGCSARYRLVLSLVGPGPDEVVDASFDVEMQTVGTQRNLVAMKATTLDLQVAEMPVERQRLSADAELESLLTEDRPVDIVRARIHIPAAAMTTDALDAFPALWSAVATTDGGNLQPTPFTPYGYMRWERCSAGADCLLSQSALLTTERAISADGSRVSVGLATDIDYLAPPYPEAGTALMATLDTPSAWVHRQMTGEFPATGVYDGFSYQISFPEIAEGTSVELAAVATLSATNGDSHTWSTHTPCGRTGCTIEIRPGWIRDPATWTVDFYWGLFDVEATDADFEPIVSEPRLFEASDY